MIHHSDEGDDNDDFVVHLDVQREMNAWVQRRKNKPTAIHHDGRDMINNQVLICDGQM